MYTERVQKCASFPDKTLYNFFLNYMIHSPFGTADNLILGITMQ